jgi:N-acyl-D-aspartate/D-glutamate deacylase
MAIDTLIRGGLLVDGTGAPARREDLAIAGGRIVGIGDTLAGPPRESPP